MSPDEARWCLTQIRRKVNEKDSDGNPIYDCADSFRAAQVWKSSQVRRFKRIRSCCGCKEWIAHRWNEAKGRLDRYVLGFNYGH